MTEQNSGYKPEPSGVRAFYAEDDARWREEVEHKLRNSGHEIVLEATTGREALDMIDQLVPLKVNLAILDNDLGDDIKGKDLVPLIRNLGIATLGFSSSGVEGADVNVAKQDGTLELRVEIGMLQYDRSGRPRW